MRYIFQSKDHLVQIMRNIRISHHQKNPLYLALIRYKGNLMKAMILAAGRGERMRHLTDGIPKPLLKIGDHALIEHNIMRLAIAGIEEIVINTAYYADQIKSHLGDGSQFDVSISYSEEGAEPLGPGGGIVNALPLLGDKHFILMAADIWSSFPIETLLDKTDHLTHLVMTENPDFHSEGDYGITDGLLTHDAPKLTYAGYSVWHPALFNDHMPGDAIELSPFIDKAIDLKAATAEQYVGNWHNIGTPEQLQYLNENPNKPH
jgi:MurNAc alpha-1-phosphate uridylyltransferase